MRNKVKTYLSVAAVFTLLWITGTIMNTHPASAQGSSTSSGTSGAPVTIVGATATVPVSVQGTATVGGTVAATQSGDWNVGITGTPTIKDSDSPARQPFQFSGVLPNEGSAIGVSFTVPSGHRLVISELSLRLAIPNPDLLNEVSVTTTANVLGTFTTTKFLVFPSLQKTLPGPNSICNCAVDFYGLNQQVTLYAEGGSSVSINASRYTADGSFFGPVSISGYLINTP
jgi:hypothetical protein